MINSFGLNLLGSMGLFMSIIKLVLIIVFVGAGIFGLAWYLKRIKSFNIRAVLFSVTRSGLLFGLDKARIVKQKDGKSFFQLYKHKKVVLPVIQEKGFLTDVLGHRIVFLIKKDVDDWVFWSPFLNLKEDTITSTFSNVDKNWFAERVRSTYEKYPKFKGFWERWGGIISVTTIVIVVIVFFIIFSQVMQDTGKSFVSAANAIKQALLVLNQTGRV